VFAPKPCDNRGDLMRRLVAGTVLCILSLIAPAGAHAASAEKEARALFQRAEMSFNLGKFPEALADYQAAYEAKPLPGFLFNIAQCYRNMGNPERARFFYRRYLALEPRTSNRRLVEDLIAEMTRLMEKQAADKQAAEKQAASDKPVAPPPAEPTPPPATPEKPVAGASPPAAVPPLAAESSTAAASLVATAPAPEPESHPVYKRWWFWTAVVAVVAGGAVAGFMLTRPPSSPHGSLDPITAPPR